MDDTKWWVIIALITSPLWGAGLVFLVAVVMNTLAITLAILVILINFILVLITRRKVKK